MNYQHILVLIYPPHMCLIGANQTAIGYDSFVCLPYVYLYANRMIAYFCFTLIQIYSCRHVHHLCSYTCSSCLCYAHLYVWLYVVQYNNIHYVANTVHCLLLSVEFTVLHHISHTYTFICTVLYDFYMYRPCWERGIQMQLCRPGWVDKGDESKLATTQA